MNSDQSPGVRYMVVFGSPALADGINFLEEGQSEQQARDHCAALKAQNKDVEFAVAKVTVEILAA